MDTTDFSHEFNTAGSDLVKLLKEELFKNQAIRSSALLNSIKYGLLKNGDELHLQFIFKSYGRFVDMGAGVEGVKARTPKKWYSRPAYQFIYKKVVYDLINSYNERIKNSLVNTPDNG